ncbi:MAG: rRNA adenine N-6-methyltransferase family protein [Roseiarcus sp.]|jgi:phosphatidylethanolamine/phosphatidyl-N-methylethanolamine N-methyltransferase
MGHSSPKFPSDRASRRSGRLFADETHFLKTLFESPRLTGAVAPSGRSLARAIARAVDPRGDGLVVELGPGTGPVTRALIEHGVARERLVLVECDGGFCRLLAQRFAPVRVVQGDAYDLKRTLAGLEDRPIAAVVSSLPLLNQPPALRAKLIEDAFALMGPDGVLVQFTYGLASPIPRESCVKKFSAHCSAPIWRNLPPARVWTYRADPNAAFAEPMIARIRRSADRLMRRGRASAE